VYTGVCIHAQAKAATGSVAAQRLGYASASRMPTRFKVRFDCGAESLIMRGVHRWRRVE
jgi:AraC-like DNA-binding protein